VTTSIIDTSAATFAVDVIEASSNIPVLVDFWAPWCGPCRVLKPILEKLAGEFGGRIRLAKLNTDEHQQIASQYGIRGIPNVKAFVDGVVADEFTGALPESQVRAFIAKLLPSAGELLRREARKLVAAGEFESAEAKLQEAVRIEPVLYVAHIELAELLVARQAYDLAEALIAEIPEQEKNERLLQLATKIDYWRRGKELPDLGELAARLEREPNNPEHRFALAERLIAEGEFESALEELIVVVRSTRGDARDQARKAMLRVFSLTADQADLVNRFRRMLAAELN
jgi:putative thioredoxin